jgi:hypothetical protein
MSTSTTESRGDEAQAPDGLTRRGVLAAGGGVAAAAGLGAAASSDALAAGVRQLGVPRHGTSALEVLGSIEQAGDELTGYGYLTRVSGLRDALLFSGAPSGESTARFTFSSSASVRARFVRPTLFSVTATGTLGVFLNARGGDFGAPATFARGTRIAAYAARFQTIVTVIAPNQAVTTVEGELLQRDARPFSVSGGRRRLGRRGLRLRLSATGPGTRTDPALPRALFDVAGRVLLAG